MARPKANIDWEVVDQYLQAHCEGTGIAGILGISADTLYRSCQEVHNIGFAEYSAQKKGEGKEMLRDKMFKMALGGDKTMLVWLSKQYLGMTDKQTVESDGKTELIITRRIIGAESND